MIEAIRPSAVQASGAWWRAASEKYGALPAGAKAALTADVNRLVERVKGLSRRDADRLEWAARRLALVVQQNEAALRLGMFAGPTTPMCSEHRSRDRRFRPTASGGREPIQCGARQEVPGPRHAYGGPSMDKGTAAEDGSVDAVLEKVATGPFLLSLHTGAVPSAVASWLSKERPLRFQVEYLRVPLGPAFDVVAFFDRATPAVRATAPR